jgi:hypothetical protein
MDLSGHLILVVDTGVSPSLRGFNQQLSEEKRL